MTRKLVIVNMSNWADEAFEIVTEHDAPTKMLMPGEHVIINPTDKQDVVIWARKVGEANGYEPPPFPAKCHIRFRGD